MANNNQNPPENPGSDPENPGQDERNQRLYQIGVRADVLRQKFSKEVDFDEEQEALNTAKFLADTIQQAIITMADNLKPVECGYLFKDQMDPLHRSVGTIKLFMKFGGKKRTVDLEFTAWSNRSDFIFEIGEPADKVIRLEYPHEEDREIIMLDICYEITNKMAELVPA